MTDLISTHDFSLFIYAIALLIIIMVIGMGLVDAIKGNTSDSVSVLNVFVLILICGIVAIGAGKGVDFIAERTTSEEEAEEMEVNAVKSTVSRELRAEALTVDTNSHSVRVAVVDPACTNVTRLEYSESSMGDFTFWAEPQYDGTGWIIHDSVELLQLACGK